MLEKIQSPRDLDGMSYEQLDQLAVEIRKELIRTVSANGGHLASNLGIVELTLALHRVFHMPEDRIIFDVGHHLSGARTGPRAGLSRRAERNHRCGR